MIHTHFNHPREITGDHQGGDGQARSSAASPCATRRVLQRGVNDSAETMTLLVQAPRLRQRAPVLRLHARPGEGRRGPAHDAGRPGSRSRRRSAARRPGSTRRRSSSTRRAAAASATRTRTSTTTATTGISVYTAPAVHPGVVYFYFDPIDLLPPEGQARWADPAEHDKMIDEARAAALADAAPLRRPSHERRLYQLRRKGGCDARKHEMFGAIDEALARLYPTRRWDERDEAAGFGAGLGAGEGDALAAALAARLRAATLYRPGAADETCDYVYVLCVGRTPSLVELRESALDGGARAALADAIAEGPVTEVYLRVALSTLAPFAAVQEVVLTRGPRSGRRAGHDRGAARRGSSTPALLKRLQPLVGVLAERNIRHLDFGEIVEPPAGFDPGGYAAEYGGRPRRSPTTSSTRSRRPPSPPPRSLELGGQLRLQRRRPSPWPAAPRARRSGRPARPPPRRAGAWPRARGRRRGKLAR